MRSTLITLCAAGCLLVTIPAKAQEFPAQGTFAVGAERLFGFAHTTIKTEIDTPAGTAESDTTSDTFFFLGSIDGTPWVAPRIGFDYFIIDSLSLGGSLTYVSDSRETDNTQPNGNTNRGPDVDDSAILFAPRVGYAYMFSEVVGIWPRGGLSYVSGKHKEDDNEDSFHNLALSLEAMLVIAPVPHAGFLVGPTLDFPFVGSGERDNGQQKTDIDKYRITTIGLQAGMFVWF
ncbi:MAG: hypothetical protein R3B13_13360 [Polyangiaceae bacterium]